jgi:ribosomal protein L25 (general stress protein Ctc)
MKSEMIKRPYLETEFSTEQVVELQKCAHDPVYFMKNYMMVMHPVKGTIPFDLYSYQEEAVKAFVNNKDVICKISRQMGKCVSTHSLITIKNRKTGEKTTLSAEEFHKMQYKLTKE